MALYLGNQKVSLRSGQDPTFDYGFDSNGRLVFANKNATEINNFLNYDSTYSEILDLSNLSKMEKVAVNGTADRKMEGLKGLLVSKNAPFTGSSPQINASYTGMNKSALVSLFESVPYNVGYTKVGNPTIVDGVASGFSTSDYLQTTSVFPNTKAVNGYEIKCKFTLPQTAPSDDEQVLGCFFRGTSDGIRVSRDGRLEWFILGGYAYIQTATNYVTFGDTYIVQCILEKNVGTLYCGTNEDNLQVAGTITLPEQYILGTPKNVFIGVSTSPQYRSPFSGAVDLNETYIKVNGVPWFTGKPAMTKTCAIVGATGTADLTQEDKNIILNKGWSLTVQ